MQQHLTTERIASDVQLQRVPAIEPALPVLDPKQLRVKRRFDVGLSAVLLIVTMPFCIVVALLVKLTSRGPVFFRQERVGKGGDVFTLIKFRTMRNGTHHEILGCEQQHAEYIANDFKLPPNDPRITWIGRLLRKSSFDELPQLFNVVRGEMSLVGIRPLLSQELAVRSRHDQDCYRVLAPGMTGLWQVKGRSTVRSIDRVRLDREYVHRWSMRLDATLLLGTPLAVLRLKHAH